MDIKKGDTVWVASTCWGSIYVDSAAVKSAGPEMVTLEKSSLASGYNVRIARDRVHPSREAALAALKKGAERDVEYQREELREAEAMVTKIEAELRTPAEGPPTP